MNEVYKKVLKIARQKVFDDPKYEEIILFCKYKLDNNIYTRNEYIKQFGNAEIETKVFVTTQTTNHFTDYKEKQRLNKTQIKREIIF